MKKMRFTGKEWKETASVLSGEKEEKSDLYNHLMAEDQYHTGEKWRELRKRSGNNKVDVDEAWERVSNRLNKNELTLTRDSSSESRGKMRILLKIAAMVFIVAALGTVTTYLHYSGYLSKKIVVTTGPDNKNLEVELEDGSRVILNRNTMLSYRADFGKHKRNVRLTGEAFFNITGDASLPFSVDAGNAEIKVLGTLFNVITENAESAVEVYVEEGKVLLSDNSGSTEMVLDPGYIGTIDSEISEKTVNTDPNYMSWNSGLLIYDGQKLDIVFKDLKKVYDIDIVADDPDILNNIWTSPIDNLPEETIIRLICTSFNLGFTKENSSYHLFVID